MKNKLIVLGYLLSTAFLGCVVGWHACEFKQVCPEIERQTLATISSTPAEKAKFCSDLMVEIPDTPEVVTEYVPYYITVEKECDCSETESKAWQECIKSYEEFQPMAETPCVGLCPIKIYRGSNHK